MCNIRKKFVANNFEMNKDIVEVEKQSGLYNVSNHFDTKRKMKYESFVENTDEV